MGSENIHVSARLVSRPPVDRKYQAMNELMCRLIYEERRRVGEKARARTPEPE
jgi:hypothetical protein